MSSTADPSAVEVDVLNEKADKPSRHHWPPQHILMIGTSAAALIALILGLSLYFGLRTPLAPIHYGFPRCYTSYPNFDTAWTNEPPVPQKQIHAANQGTELRPLTGFTVQPYQAFVTADCANTTGPIMALGPHWVGLGLTEYRPTTAKHAFPASFEGKLFVTAHGSWNRVPWIGHRVDAFDVDFDAWPYSFRSRQVFVPPMRVIVSGTPDTFSPPATSGDYTAIRPVDLRSSPVDGSLLFTADRDDYMRPANGHNTGGLYRVRYGPASSPPPQGVEPAIAVPRAGWPLGGVIGSDGNFELEQLAVIPCARQMSASRTSPRRLLYVSTLKEFCEHTNKDMPDIDKGAIWAVELDADSGLVRRKARLVEGLLDPQGIDWANGTLYVATSGRGSEQRGNCVLRMRDVDAIAEAVLAAPTTSMKAADTRVEDVACGFTSIQVAGHSRGHAWRSLRVTPSGRHALVQVGSDCNWAADCVPSDTNHHTNFLMVDVHSGRIHVVAGGIRNAVGMHFDRHGHLLWIDNGSDDGEGLPGAPPGGTGEHGNRPDGELNLLDNATIAAFEAF